MPINKESRFLLLYGSQTGQAKAIAEEIAEQAEQHNLHADTHCLSLTEKKFYIERETCVVIVTSTTGDGEPPDTALKFVRRLRKRTLPSNYLAHLNYALLGLGDSNYTNFCKCGKSLDRRLQDLGAKHFYNSGWGDDAVGLEVAVEPWIEGLWPALKKHLNGSLQNGDISDNSILHGQRDSSQHGENNCLHYGVPSVPIPINMTTRTEKAIESAIDQQVADRNTSDNNSNSQQINQRINSSEGNVEEKVQDEVTEVSNSLNKLAVTDQSASVDTLTANIDVVLKIGDQSSANCDLSMKIDDQSKGCEGNSNQSCDSYPVRDQLCDSSVSSSTVASIQQSISPLSDSNLNVPVLSPAYLRIDYNADEALSCDSYGVRDQLCDSSVSSSRVATIQQSISSLTDNNLSVPVLSPANLKINYNADETLDISKIPLQNGCQFPSAASPVTMATVISATTMTTKESVKKAMVVQLDISECNLQYQPGDSFSLVCPNPAGEVDNLLQRLILTETADKVYHLTVLSDTKKKNASVPKHVPDKSSLRQLFTTCLDIREPPKKALLRVLVEYTDNPGEKRRLQELCSKQGSDDFAKFIREPSLSLLDILNHFKSCCPPVERLIEHLPRLQPRPYSICSSPLTSQGTIEFVFNVIEIGSTNGRTYDRKGVCTGWLEKFETNSQDKSDLAGKVENISLSPSIQVPVFARTNQHFHLPTDPSSPVIMIGPGTGVAPFMGFLKHRAAIRVTTPDTKPGDAWLFYGCRHKDKDYLYREEMDQHLKSGNLTNLCVSFSRDQQAEDAPRYVQDNIRRHGEALVKLIEDNGAVIYVCGDAKNMAKDVNQAFVDVFATVKGIPEAEARKLVMQLRLHKHYLEDVWT